MFFVFYTKRIFFFCNKEGVCDLKGEIFQRETCRPLSIFKKSVQIIQKAFDITECFKCKENRSAQGKVNPFLTVRFQLIQCAGYYKKHLNVCISVKNTINQKHRSRRLKWSRKHLIRDVRKRENYF